MCFTIHVDSSSFDNILASQGGAIYLLSASQVPNFKVFDNNFVSSHVTGNGGLLRSTYRSFVWFRFEVLFHECYIINFLLHLGVLMVFTI